MDECTRRMCTAVSLIHTAILPRSCVRSAVTIDTHHDKRRGSLHRQSACSCFFRVHFVSPDADLLGNHDICIL